MLAGGNVPCEVVRKISEAHPNIGDMVAGGQIAFMINTPFGQESRGDGYHLRTEAVRRGVTCITALSAANAFVAAVEALEASRRGGADGLEVIALQDLPQHEV